MPRFYFDLADGGTIVDDEGMELPSLRAAEQQAVAAARDVMRHEVWQGRLPLNQCVRILDERRQLLQIVRFRDVLQIPD